MSVTVEQIYPLAAETTSLLRDGIETLTIPIHAPHMQGRVINDAAHGRETLIRGLLYHLGRLGEVDRVCGIKVTTQGPMPVIILELRQPGLEFERLVQSTLGGDFLLTINVRWAANTELLVNGNVVATLNPRALKGEHHASKEAPDNHP